MKHQILANPVILLATVLLLNACGNQTPTTNISASPTPTSNIVPVEKVKQDKTKFHGGKGGQVIEIRNYHLELLTSKEAGGFHLDFYLQNGTDHRPIANATVTGNVQLPDGTQQNLEFKYNDKDKHYTALLSSQVPGDYKLTVLSNINGKNVNGRFNFKH